MCVPVLCRSLVDACFGFGHLYVNLIYYHMFINPFEKRSFGARFAAVFSFAKQNFFSVLKFYLPVLLLVSLLMFFLTTLSQDSTTSVIASQIMFINCAYMALYVKYNGVVGSFSFKECYSTLGRSFLISIEAGFCTILYLCFPLILILLILLFIKPPFILFITLVTCLVFCAIILSQLYSIHYYFSYKEYKSSFTLFKEVFCMLKGRLLSTLLYIFVFDVLIIAVMLPFVIADACIGYDIFIYLFMPLFAFFVQSNAMVFQYAHLRTSWENEKLVDSE